MIRSDLKLPFTIPATSVIRIELAVTPSSIGRYDQLFHFYVDANGALYSIELPIEGICDLEAIVHDINAAE